ncbi:MAG: methyltransferase domain-containing protein [Myxococcota bacterium]
MSTSFRRLGQSELLPRYIFAESLYARRRVLEVGAVASTLGQSARFLATRGARIVVACDADIAAVEEAKARFAEPNLRFRANVYDDLEPGSFDLVMVADLAPYVRAPELLKELVRLIAPNGFLMGGLRNAAGLALSQVMDPEEEAPPTYGQLVDALSTHFQSIEVATQSPVLGYQLAFEKGEGLQVDGSLAGTSEAAYFVVLAGNEPVRNFDPTWVQLPPEPLAYTGGRLEEYTQRARNWEERSTRLKEALAQARHEAHTRQAEALGLRESLEESKEAVRRLTAQLESLAARPEVDRRQDELAARLRRVEAELEVAKERAADAEGHIARVAKEAELQEQKAKDANVLALAAQEEVRLERARKDEVTRELNDTRERLTQSYEELRRVQDEAVQARIELQRGKLAADRAGVVAADHERALAASKERELRLAEQLSQAVSAVEHLQGKLAHATSSATEAQDLLLRKEADLAQALRMGEADAEAAARLKDELAAERVRAEELVKEIQGHLAERAALETELVAARASADRLARDVQTLAGSERAARDLAQVLEEKLADAAERAEQNEAELEVARARSGRLEKDLTTTLGAERSAREQAEVALAEERAAREADTLEVARLSEQLKSQGASSSELQEQLETSRQELRSALSRTAELQTELDAAVEQARALQRERDQAQAEAHSTAERVAGLEADFGDARRSLEEANARATQLQGALEEEQRRNKQHEAELSSEAAGAQERLEQAHRLAAERLAEQERLRVELADVQGARAEAQKERDEKLAAAEQAREELGRALEEKLVAETQARQQAQVELAERTSALESARAERDARGAELAELRAQVESARSEARGHQSAKLTLQEELDTARDELAAWKAQVGALESARAALQADLATAHSALDQVGAEAKALKETSLAQEAELVAARVKAREADELFTSAKDTLAATQTELPRLRERVEALEAEQRFREEERARLTGEVERLEAERAALFGKLEALDDETSQLRTASLMATQKENQLTAVVAEKDQKLDLLQRRLTAQETELSALRRVLGRGAASSPPSKVHERRVERAGEVKDEVTRPVMVVPPAKPAPVPHRPSAPTLPKPFATDEFDLSVEELDEPLEMGEDEAIPPSKKK